MKRSLALAVFVSVCILAAVSGVLTPRPVDAVTGKLFSFRSYNAGRFIIAVGGGTELLSTASGSFEPWDTFDIIVLHHDTLHDGAEIQIRCFNSQFVSAEGGGGGAVNCNRNVAQSWETFTIFRPTAMGSSQLINVNDYVQIKANNGMFLKTQNSDGTGPIVANGNQRDKYGLFRIGMFDGQLPQLDQMILEKGNFSSSSFPSNAETSMGGCSLTQRDAFVFNEPVPGGKVIGVWTQLSCSGSINGVRVNPEYFRDVALKNGWHVVDFVAPDTSNNGCNGSVSTRPVIGSHTPYAQLHLACPAFRAKAENVVSMVVAGPHGWSMQ